MRWRSGRRSDNVEDQRSEGGGFAGGGGGIPLLPMLLRLGGRRGGIWTILIVVAFMYFTGGDLGGLLSGLTGVQVGPAPSSRQGQVQENAAEKELVEFVKVVLADTEDTWTQQFRQLGKQYQEPRLVLFRGAVRSACGMAQAAMGPFYCPGDHRVYIDLSFYEDMKKRHNAPGDFAQAYVIAHEVGHHVQTLLGISQRIAQTRDRVGEVEANRLSVRQELQADCFAGVWAHHADRARNILEQGDVQEALNAASAIGDDRLQRQSSGTVTPDSFTHGTSAQRVKWFKIGIESGSLNSCDTFSARSL
ncbi:MAG: neutral zinc metallopeptidase [Gammaproteobacteria bacterium]|nr:neutral zinc metallopeptidase [Gammaproteobacteria bacterium]MBU1656300.1 neutral zinc metallopeptidase [Gammaproteobacteria bacterium]MBU1959865.1 neutral zinc metallopeptidase [Gammaproteobacteria bacterium]